MAKRKSYADRTDLERLASSWVKHQGFMDRGEWSAAVTRAATAAEIAANIAVRNELEDQRQLEKPFVDSLLLWANGLDGKLNRLLTPLSMDQARKDVIRRAQKASGHINKKRNEVVHSGHFMNHDEANDVRDRAIHFIDALVGLYHTDFSVETAAEIYRKSRPSPISEKIGVQNS